MNKHTVIMAMLIVSIISASSLFAQTRQERRQIKQIEKELNKLDFNVVRLETKIQKKGYMPVDYFSTVKALKGHIDSLSRMSVSNLTDFQRRDSLISEDNKTLAYCYQQLCKYPDNKALVEQLDHDWNRIAQLTKERERIFDHYANNAAIPDEMTNNTVHRRLNANVVKREDLVISKISDNLYGQTGQANGLITSQGYKVILHNYYCDAVSFNIIPLNGGDKTSYNLQPYKKSVVYLVPGQYEVHYISCGVEICQPRPLVINGQIMEYDGEKCYNYAYMPSRVHN